jgi:hypothetical protein
MADYQPKDTSLELYVQIYPGNPEAISRMKQCIAHNSRLRFVQRIHVFNEGIKDIDINPKVSYEEIERRLSFAELVNAIFNTIKPLSSHIAIANSDIFLSDDIYKVLNKIRHRNTVIALTRREIDGHFLFNPKLSQDVWILKNHSPNEELQRKIQCYPGVAGCEHIFAMGLFCEGYEIWNPCLDCSVTHNDPKPKTKWSIRHHGAYLYIPPCQINDIENTKTPYEIHISRNQMSNNS